MGLDGSNLFDEINDVREPSMIAANEKLVKKIKEFYPFLLLLLSSLALGVS